ncbi:MAG TPA: hypothetical protein VG826_17885 [Pirellulales bacterium]|nr:hypothetical protein [Pirellulales bacterium]
MTHRWAVMVTFAMLLSTGLPATARGQSARPAAGSTGAADDGQPTTSSPANRFAAIVAKAQVDLPQPPGRPSKRSVLEPVTPRWLEEDASEPPQAATSPQTLTPDILSPPSDGPAPEAMPEELAPGAVAGPLLDTDLLPPGRQRLFERMPRIGPARQPLMRESWQFRPFYISVFEGALFVTAPVVPEFRNGASYFTGFRLGWDFGAHFGSETRFGFSKVFLFDRTHSTEIGYEKIFYFDSNLLYYPFGDTRWRPFFSIGGGLGDVQIVSTANGTLHPDTFNLPIGGGIKYRYGSRVAFRADIRDNITISGNGGLRTLNNVELLGGVEFHFGGGERRSYWPWNPSRHWW